MTQKVKQQGGGAGVGAKVIDAVHETHLAEAIKMLGRAIGMAKQTQRKHWWQRSHFSKQELQLLSSRLELLLRLHTYYEQWHDQLQQAIEKQSVEQYDDLQALLGTMNDVVASLLDSGGQHKQWHAGYNQIMVWVRDEVTSFKHDLMGQYAQLVSLDRSAKEQESALIRCLLQDSHDDLRQISLRMSRLYTHLHGYRQQIHALYGKHTLNAVSLWFHSHDPVRSFTAMCQSFEDSYNQLSELSMKLEDMDGVHAEWPASFRATSTLVDQYSEVAKLLFTVHLMLLEQQKHTSLAAEMDDLIAETRAVFDTVKSLRASQLLLLLYKIDHHRHCYSDAGERSQIERLLAGDDFEILRYSKQSGRQPNEVKRISQAINKSQGFAQTPTPLSPL